jgi:hypothetical protein
MDALATMRIGRHAAAEDALGRMAAGARGKSMTLSEAAQAFLRGTDIGDSPGFLVEPLDPFQQSLWFNKCVRAVCRSSAAIPLRLSPAGEGMKYTKAFRAEIRPVAARTLRPLAGRSAVCQGKAAAGGAGGVVESGPAWDLLTRPNDYQDWPALVAATIGFYIARGRAAWILADMPGRRPRSIHAVDGRRVTPILTRDKDGIPALVGYKYRPPGSGGEVGLAPDECKYFALWAGTDNPLEGLAPSLPGRFALATDYAASMFNAAALSANAEPGIHLDLGPNPTAEQIEKARQDLTARHSGPAKARRNLVTWGGAKAEAWQTSFADLQFQEGKGCCRLEICALLDVPPFVAGWMDSALTGATTYVQTALRHYYADNIFPLVDSFTPAIQEIVSRFDFRLVAWWDVDSHPAVLAQRQERIAPAKDLAALGYPINMINERLDLGMEEVPWGDEGTLAAGLVPARDVMAGTGFGDVPEGPGPGGAGSELVPPSRFVTAGKAEAKAEPALSAALERIWRAWARSWATLAKQTRQMLRSHLFAQERRILAALAAQSQTGAAALTRAPRRLGAKAVDVDHLLVEIFADPSARQAFRVRVRSALLDGQELGLRQALSEAGLAGQPLEDALKKLMTNPRITDALSKETVKIAGRIDDRTRLTLRASLQEGLAAGEDVRKLATRVQAVMGTRRGQAMATARNTVGQVLSMARHEGQRAVGMTHKLWIHTRGPEAEPRPAHVAAEGYYAAHPCPIDEPFVINGVALMYPRDFSSGVMEETMNCQCMTISRRFAPAESVMAAAFIEAYRELAFASYRGTDLTAKSAKNAKGNESPV